MSFAEIMFAKAITRSNSTDFLPKKETSALQGRSVSPTSSTDKDSSPSGSPSPESAAARVLSSATPSPAEYELTTFSTNGKKESPKHEAYESFNFNVSKLPKGTTSLLTNNAAKAMILAGRTHQDFLAEIQGRREIQA